MALGTWAAALALAEMVPTLFKWIGGEDKSGKKSQDFGDIAGYIVEIAKRVSGVDHADDAIKNLQKNKKMFLRFQSKRLIKHRFVPIFRGQIFP